MMEIQREREIRNLESMSEAINKIKNLQNFNKKYEVDKKKYEEKRLVVEKRT